MLSDLTIHEPVGDKLEHLDLTRGRILSELAVDLRSEGDDRSMSARTPSRGSRLEASAVIAITVQDLLPLSGVHEAGIGGCEVAL